MFNEGGDKKRGMRWILSFKNQTLFWYFELAALKTKTEQITAILGQKFCVVCNGSKECTAL